jgi:hypothetical protein
MHTGKRRRLLGRLTATAALAAMVGGLGLVAAAPAHAAGTTLKLDRVHCVVENDWIGGDSPYVLVFATSPSNPNGTRFGKWGPGSWDGNVDPGDVYFPNGTITTSVQSNWTMWTMLMEEDDGNDLSSGDIAYIGTALHNQWQVSFWHDSALAQLEMFMAYYSVVDNVVGNDDILGMRKTSAGVNTHFNSDDADYWIRLKVV